MLSTFLELWLGLTCPSAECCLNIKPQTPTIPCKSGTSHDSSPNSFLSCRSDSPRRCGVPRVETQLASLLHGWHLPAQQHLSDVPRSSLRLAAAPRSPLCLAGESPLRLIGPRRCALPLRLAAVLHLTAARRACASGSPLRLAAAPRSQLAAPRASQLAAPRS
jgi:hypothetical protein